MKSAVSYIKYLLIFSLNILFLLFIFGCNIIGNILIKETDFNYKIGIKYSYVDGKYTAQSNILSNQWKKNSQGNWEGIFNQFNIENKTSTKSNLLIIKGFLESTYAYNNLKQYELRPVPSLNKQNGLLPLLIIIHGKQEIRPDNLKFYQERNHKEDFIEIEANHFVMKEEHPSQIVLATEIRKEICLPALHLYFEKTQQQQYNKVNTYNVQKQNSQYKLSQSINTDRISEIPQKKDNFQKFANKNNYKRIYDYENSRPNRIGMNFIEPGQFYIKGNIYSIEWKQYEVDSWIGKLYTFKITKFSPNNIYQSEYQLKGFAAVDIPEERDEVEVHQKNCFSRNNYLYVYLHGFTENPGDLNFNLNYRHSGYNHFVEIDKEHFFINNKTPDRIEFKNKTRNKYGKECPVVHLYYDDHADKEITIKTIGYNKYQTALQNKLIIQCLKNKKIIGNFEVTESIVKKFNTNMIPDTVRLYFQYDYINYLSTDEGSLFYLNLKDHINFITIIDKYKNGVPEASVNICLNSKKNMNELINRRHSFTKKGLMGRFVGICGCILPFYKRAPDNTQIYNQSEELKVMFSGKTDKNGRISFIAGHIPFRSLRINVAKKGYNIIQNKSIHSSNILLDQSYFGMIRIFSENNIPINNASVNIHDHSFNGLVYVNTFSNTNGEAIYNFSGPSSETPLIITIAKSGYNKALIPVFADQLINNKISWTLTKSIIGQFEDFNNIPINGDTNRIFKGDMNEIIKRDIGRDMNKVIKRNIEQHSKNIEKGIIKKNEIQNETLIIINESTHSPDAQGFKYTKEAVLTYLNEIRWPDEKDVNDKLNVAVSYDSYLSIIKSLEELIGEYPKYRGDVFIQDQLDKALELFQGPGNKKIIYLISSEQAAFIPSAIIDYISIESFQEKGISINFIIYGEYGGNVLNEITNQTGGTLFYCKSHEEIYKKIKVILKSVNI